MSRSFEDLAADEVGEHGLASRWRPTGGSASAPRPEGRSPADRLVAIANAARVDPHPDTSWIGGR